MFDFHCHFFNNEKVEWFVLNTGLNPETNKKVLESGYFKALGIHPTEVLNWKEDQIEVELYNIENLLKEKKINAIGEVGLDFKFSKDPKIVDWQKELFERFLELAENYDVPIIIHSREAEEEVSEILKTYYNLKAVLHSFNYSRLDLVEDLVEEGYYFTISFAYTKKLNYFIEKIPIEQILVESDYPFKSHGKTLDLIKKFLPKTIEKISEIKNLDKKETEKIIDENSFKLLELKSL